MSKRRNIRKVVVRSDSESELASEVEGELRGHIEATRELQKLRAKSKGLTATDLAGTSLQGSQTVLGKARVDSELLGGYIKEQIRETGGQDNDPEREKFIEEQLNKRLGRSILNAQEPLAPETDAYAIPASLRAQKANQEDVSTWMTGIVEVPLTVGNKLENIEATEMAKKRLLHGSEWPALETKGLERMKSPSKGLVRVSYPLRFGKQTGKEEDWRARAIQKSMQPSKRKRTQP